MNQYRSRKRKAKTTTAKRTTMKTSEIKFTVEMDENKLPVNINWEATDIEQKGKTNCKSIMLSMWDPKEHKTLKIDLWTKEMTTDEMKIFFHQTLVSMANTLERATGEEKMAGDMRDFCEYFAETLQLIKKQ